MRLRLLRILAFAGVAGLAAAALAAQKSPARKATPSSSPAATPSPAVTSAPAVSAACSGPTYRQFDFWLGEWDLVGVDGKKSAEDRIVSILGGCAIQQNGSSTESGQRMSVSAYDPATRHWHQTLIDDGGALLNLEGEFASGKMVLVGERPSVKEKGATVTHRITWTAMPDHRVRKSWDFSTNGGRLWKPVSDGYYVPKK